MKKHYILSAIAALALASCSSDDFLGEYSKPVDGDNTTPIGFFNGAIHNSRASHAESAALLGGKFVVFGESFAGTTTTPIFNNYVVTYGAGTAGSTVDNTNDWAYAGNTSLLGALQDVKYWNFSTDKYQFVAASGLAAGETIKNTSDGMRINVADADALTSIYVSNRATATPTAQAATSTTPASTAYKDVVTFNFRRLASQMRIGFYETIPGYAVKNLVFYYVGAPSGSTTVGAGGAYPASGKYTVTYDDATNDAHVKFSGSANAMDFSKTFGKLDYTTAKSKFSSADKAYIDAHGNPVAAAAASKVFLGTTAGEATFGKGTYTIDGTPGVASDYRPILPNESNSLSIQLRVDYTLVSLDGSGEEIQVRDAYVKVPLQYCKWAPNTSYTYLFKITDQTNGYTGVGGGGTVNPGPDDPGFDPDNAGRDPEPTTGGDNDPEVDGGTGEVIPPYIPDPTDPNPTIPNPDYDPNPTIPNPGFDPDQPVDPITNPDVIPNPGYDPNPEIPNPDVPLVPNPAYPDIPGGPEGDQHDPSNPVPTPEDPLNPGQPDPENPASLFPITFDAVVIDSEEFSQETVTVIETPSITTYAEGSNVTGNNEYKKGEVIVLSAESSSTLSIVAWDYTVSASAITEAQAKLLPASTVWTPIADSKFTAGSAGYYVVRLTYNTDKVAYKVVKVVE